MIDEASGATPGAGGPGHAVRVTPSREAADEWGVVLAAAGIPYWVRRRLDGWALLVAPRDVARATAALDAYERENRAEGEAVPGQTVPLDTAVTLGLVVALLLAAVFAVAGPRAGRSEWIVRGSADAGRIVTGEWWRVVTALTLHADASHLLGNVVGAALLLPAVFAELGPGVGLTLVLLAGAAGNLLTAVVHGGGHVSVGASTAVFGAIGILAALRMVGPARSRARRRWMVVAASLALLALVGVAPDADLLAHLSGVLAGAALGLVASPPRARIASSLVQWALVAAALAATGAAWRAAL